MEKAKDGVTLIADAIRAEMKQAEEKAKQTATPPANVIDVTAQFKATPATPPVVANAESKPPTPANTSDNAETPNANAGNDDGTIYKNE